MTTRPLALSIDTQDFHKFIVSPTGRLLLASEASEMQGCVSLIEVLRSRDKNPGETIVNSSLDGSIIPIQINLHTEASNPDPTSIIETNSSSLTKSSSPYLSRVHEILQLLPPTIQDQLKNVVGDHKHLSLATALDIIYQYIKATTQSLSAPTHASDLHSSILKLQLNLPFNSKCPILQASSEMSSDPGRRIQFLENAVEKYEFENCTVAAALLGYKHEGQSQGELVQTLTRNNAVLVRKRRIAKLDNTRLLITNEELIVMIERLRRHNTDIRSESQMQDDAISRMTVEVEVSQRYLRVKNILMEQLREQAAL